MKLLQTLVRIPFTKPSPALPHSQNFILNSNGKRVSLLGYRSLRFSSNCACSISGASVTSSETNTGLPLDASNSNSGFDHVETHNMPGKLDGVEEVIEKGSTFVAESFLLYLVNRSRVIQMLIEALDLYLLGTVMLVFGMGLYEIFVSNLGSASSIPHQKPSDRSNLFGLFTLMERPKWLDIKTVNELKTKVGHVIVMLLLIGLFDRSKKAAINSPLDLLCFCASILLSSTCLFLLSKLNEAN